MRYLTEPKHGKYVKGYGFLSFSIKLYKYNKKRMDTAAKTGIGVAKTVSERIYEKNCRSYRRFD